MKRIALLLVFVALASLGGSFGNATGTTTWSRVEAAPPPLTEDEMSEVIAALMTPEGMAAMAGLLTFGGLVVKLTPTKKDDEWWAALMRTLGRGKP